MKEATKKNSTNKNKDAWCVDDLTNKLVKVSSGLYVCVCMLVLALIITCLCMNDIRMMRVISAVDWKAFYRSLKSRTLKKHELIVSSFFFIHIIIYFFCSSAASMSESETSNRQINDKQPKRIHTHEIVNSREDLTATRNDLKLWITHFILRGFIE